jgi:hypothetical protein
MDQELRKALNLKFSHLRDSEAALAFNKAPEKTEAAISEQIELHRRPHAEGRVSSIGSAVFASTDTWKAIAADSEKAARSELLASSPEMAQLTELEAKALAATQAAAAKNAEVTRFFNEWQSLPAKIEAQKERLNVVVT